MKLDMLRPKQIYFCYLGVNWISAIMVLCFQLGNRWVKCFWNSFFPYEQPLLRIFCLARSSVLLFCEVYYFNVILSEECRLLGCGAVYILCELTFRRNDWAWLSLQPPAHAGSSLAEFSTRKMEAVRSSETSVHTRSTRHHIQEDGILHTPRHESPKSYTIVSAFTKYFKLFRGRYFWWSSVLKISNWNFKRLYTGDNADYCNDNHIVSVEPYIFTAGKPALRVSSGTSVYPQWIRSRDRIEQRTFHMHCNVAA
jgi:hypothetical protein